jgi:lysophospholipase L1-like esterase
MRRAVLGAASTVAAAVLVTGVLSASPIAHGSTPASAPPAARYVALGDSYTSGPLIPEQTGKPAGCLRSNHDYPALVAAATHPAALTDVSCQGADTTNMTHSQGVILGTNAPQFNALRSHDTLVTVQIGGNDFGITSIFLVCAGLSFLNPFGAPCKHHYTSGGTDRLARSTAQIAPKIAALLQGIHARAPQARVLLVGYPDLLPNAGSGCWPEVPVAHGDVSYLRGVEFAFNKMLATTAAANHATFVNTYVDSIGHDLCQSPSVRWIEDIIPTSPAAPIHPNEHGEQAMARQVLAALH